MRTNVELTLDDDDDSLEDLTHPEDQEFNYNKPSRNIKNKQKSQSNGHINEDSNDTAVITSDVPLVEYLNDDNDSYGSFGNESCSYSVSSITDGISHVMSHWKVLLFGQLLSVAMAASGASATDLVNRCSLNAPTFQFGLLYFALTGHLVYLLIQHYCKGDRNFKYSSSSPYTFPGTSMPLGAPWWFFFVLAILNVEANFFTILAFRYTTLTSITLFDSLAIPAAMFTSKQLLGCKYYPSHIAGAAICFVGVVINVAVDLQIEEEEDLENPGAADHRMLGDVLAMAGGILYGVNDTLQELMVKKFSQTEFLGLLGFYGTLISVVQVLFLEMEEVAKFFNGESRCETETGLSLLAVFFVATYTNYVGRAKFLTISEAALLNLSLLTADLFSVLFSVFVEHIHPNPVFYAALVLIMSGVVVYEIGPSPMVDVSPRDRRISTSNQLAEFEMPDQLSVV